MRLLEHFHARLGQPDLLLHAMPPGAQRVLLEARLSALAPLGRADVIPRPKHIGLAPDREHKEAKEADDESREHPLCRAAQIRAAHATHLR